MNERLIELRKALGFKSQKDFAEVLDMPTRTLQAYEQGTSPIIPSTLIQKLMLKFDASAEWLLLGHGDMFAKNNFIIKNFENSQFLYDQLNDEDIQNALISAYVDKTIMPLIRDIGAEKPFWKKALEGHRDRISAVFYLLSALSHVKIEDIQVADAKNTLKNTIEEYTLTVGEKIKFTFIGKDSLFQTIEKLDDVGCYLILKNADVIAQALSPFIKSAHLEFIKSKKEKH